MEGSRKRGILLRLCLLLFSLGAYVALSNHVVADNPGKGDDNPVCSSACSLDRICGSSSVPCVVNVKRTNYSASATPKIPDAKGNASFCVKVGTTIVWQSSSKNTGFILDFGQTTPFGSQKTITGGSKKPVSVVVDKEGCFKYTVSACKEAALSGMCESGNAELVVTSGGG